MTQLWKRLMTQAKAPLSAVMVCVVLFIQTLAASPVFHLDVHDDASSSSHECVVTTFSQGQLDLSTPTVVAVIPRFPHCEFVPSSEVRADLWFQALASPRGPPVLS